jgi:hypothetical protein
MACSLLSKMMDETELEKAQLCHDLQPFFGEVRPPTKLKKVLHCSGRSSKWYEHVG